MYAPRTLLGTLSRSSCLAAILAAAACGPPQDVNAPRASASASTSAEVSAPKAPDLSVPPVVWENPGGMWKPEQVAQQGDLLKKLGFTIDPSAFANPGVFPLAAIVSLGGCTASFVSPDGLIITNHHCVIGALQYNSTEKENLLKDGFLAKTRADERTNGPSSRVFVTLKFTDVTKDVRDGLEKLGSDMARYQAIEDRQKLLVSECEKGREGVVKCSVAQYFGGAEFALVEQLEIRDVRLVYAPPEGVGNYGGETDNWRWPRHAGDFGFFRAYVGKDGKPADFSKDNVPYNPKHYLRVAKDELKPGDPVMVTGYPANTNRYTTAAETNDAVTWDQPHVLDFCAAYLKELERVKALDANAAIKAETLIRGLANWQTNVKGQLEGLVKAGQQKKKEALEAELKTWIDADPDRKKKYGGVLEKMEKLLVAHDKTREGDAAFGEALRMTRILSTALTIVRNAEEREKPDDKRDPSFQERNQPRLAAGFSAMTKAYDPRVDSAMFALAVRREMALKKEDQPGIAKAMKLDQLPKGVSLPGDPVALAIDAMYKTTTLGDEATRLDLLKSAKLADLKKSTDPFIQLAIALRPTQKTIEDRDKQFAGAMSTLRPLFVEALKAKLGGALAPDANRTLRVTYGTVRGYSPKEGEPVYYPFTKLSELVAKNQGKGEFDAPKALLDAVANKKFGKYVDTKMQEVPVDFLSDLDITGGNSGSPTLDAKGDLVGLAFDGNYESMASNWVFMPAVTRTIHVDIRYVLWFADAVSHADNVLAELGVAPSAR
ncbi:MAG: S46 family peptidase [Polyangiaceae bacterium]